MKKILFAVVVLLVAGAVVFAQQRPPSSVQTRQEAQQLLTQTRANSNEFQTSLNDLRVRNTSNSDAGAYQRLRTEIQQLESMITAERSSIENRLDRGVNVSAEVLSRFDRMLNQHRAKLTELENFIANN